MRHERTGHPRKKGKFALRILGVPAFLFLGAWIFQMLWNYATPTAFGAGIISYWQAVALLIAARILVGMPRRAFGRADHPSRFHSRDEWKAHMREHYGRGRRPGGRSDGRPGGRSAGYSSDHPGMQKEDPDTESTPEN